MAYDWQSSAAANGSKGQQPMFMCMSTTVDDLSYTPSEEEKHRDAVQIEATGRRSWKTIKGKGEAVWPPNLEAALIEALERYQPDAVGSKSNKAVGRFPMRNRFISDYIYETTGKRRTPKQVGSRLQQLRDTCREERILKLISHNHGRDSPSSEGSHVGASLSPPPEVRDNTPTRSTRVHVEITLQRELWPAPRPCIHFIHSDASGNNAQTIHLAPSASTPQALYGQSSRTSTTSMASFMRLLNASVEFISPCALILQSTFYIYVDNSETAVHSEVVPLQCVSSPMHRSGWLYSTDLAPAYWDKIISSQDLNRYTILQVLKPISSSDMGSNLNDAQRTSRSISVVYKFNIPEITRSKEPVSPPAYSLSLSSSSAATPRQSTSDLAYCQWQPDLGTSTSIGGVDQQPATSRYYVTSNTRGDPSSHTLESSSSHPHAMADSSSSYVSSSHSHSSGSPAYVSAPLSSAGGNNNKYHLPLVDSYYATTSAGYYSPPSHHHSWQSEQLPAQSYHTAQPHWGTNYC